MPDVTFATADLVPDWAKEYAKEIDGKFVVKLAPEVKVQEFRDTNIRVSQERDTFKAAADQAKKLLGDKTPEEVLAEMQTLREVQQQVKDGTLKPGTDVQAEVDRRVLALKADFERQNSELAQGKAQAEARAETENKRWRQSVVDRAITDAVLDASSGAEHSALPDIVERAYKVFQVDPTTGKLVAKDGDAIIYGSDGATPMSPKEWLAKLRERAPYFFKASNGGGASGGGNRATGNTLPGGVSKEDFLKMPAPQRMAYAAKHKITSI